VRFAQIHTKLEGLTNVLRVLELMPVKLAAIHRVNHDDVYRLTVQLLDVTDDGSISVDDVVLKMEQGGVQTVLRLERVPPPLTEPPAPEPASHVPAALLKALPTAVHTPAPPNRRPRSKRLPKSA
jgi:hypothetical protein